METCNVSIMPTLPKEVKTLFLICALAPAPWGFLNSLAHQVRIKTLAELAVLDDKYPGWTWSFIRIKELYAEPPWFPTPWVFEYWRIWAKRSA